MKRPACFKEHEFQNCVPPCSMQDMEQDTLDKFDKAIEFTLTQEGVYSNDIYDKGGSTKYGISKKAYPDVDIENLTLDDAVAIYRRDYWDASNLTKVNSEKVAMAIFDWSVNSGVWIAVKSIQGIVGAKKDGILGPKTIACINSAKDDVIFAYMKDRKDFYVDIVKRNNTQIRFLKGWLNRIINILQWDY